MTMNRVVLVVDDELELRKLLSIQLRREGFSVLSAESSEKALELLRSGIHIDALVSDIRMPGGMDGIELIKTMQRENIKLPVNILMSGHAILYPEEIKSLRINQCLSKPFSVKKLISILWESLNSVDESVSPRKHPRLRADFPIEEETNFGMGEGSTCDISLGGLFIKMEPPFPIGTKFVVKVELEREMRLKLEVKWTREKKIGEKPAGMGCEFVDISGEDAKTIREHLDGLTEGPTDLHEVFKKH